MNEIINSITNWIKGIITAELEAQKGGAIPTYDNVRACVKDTVGDIIGDAVEYELGERNLLSEYDIDNLIENAVSEKADANDVASLAWEDVDYSDLADSLQQYLDVQQMVDDCLYEELSDKVRDVLSDEGIGSRLDSLEAELESVKEGTEGQPEESRDELEARVLVLEERLSSLLGALEIASKQ